MSQKIQPKQSAAKAKDGNPFTAVSFSITATARGNDVLGAYPIFYDASGSPLPNGAIPLVKPIEQKAESELLAAAILACPGLAGESSVDHLTRGGAAVVVQTRGVVLA